MHQTQGERAITSRPNDIGLVHNGRGKGFVGINQPDRSSFSSGLFHAVQEVDISCDGIDPP